MSIANEPGSTNHSVWEIFLHPEWNSENTEFDADISIVVLRDHIGFSNNVQLICLPQPNDIKVDGTGTVVGWGVSEHSEAADEHFDPIPNELELPAVDQSYCFATFPALYDISTSRTFCAGFVNKQKSACSGDSGCGFYLFNPSTELFELKGIVSASLVDPVAFDRGCNINAFSIFTNVAKFAKWIGMKIEEKKEIDWEEVEFDCRVQRKYWVM